MCGGLFFQQVHSIGGLPICDASEGAQQKKEEEKTIINSRRQIIKNIYVVAINSIYVSYLYVIKLL